LLGDEGAGQARRIGVLRGLETDHPVMMRGQPRRSIWALPLPEARDMAQVDRGALDELTWP
jgi:hypothetical protein